MSHCVPDFGLEFDDPCASAATPLRHKAADLPADQLFELLWRNGPVAHPVLYDRLRGRSPPEIPVAGPPLPAGMAAAEAEAEAAARQLFIEEDEMASWLHYQIGEDGDGGNELYGELLGSSMDGGRIPADQVAEAYTTQVDVLPQPPPPEKFRRVLASGESAVVDSNETPGVAAPPGRGLLLESRRAPAGIGEPCASEQGMTSSSVASGERDARAHADERKRKAREDDDSGYQSEDAEFRSGDKRKSARRSASTRRARAAEVHNLSERRRRDRINEKMKALQELIPRCNKTDKASMLDEAIEYLKSLQLQVQMMSMGCSMGTVMFPGVQMYIPPMGMGMGMGIATGSEVGPASLGHPMLQFGHVLPCRPIVGPTARPQLAPRPLMPSSHPPSIAIADQSRVQASSRQDPASNPVSMLGPNMVRIPNVANRYHHYAGSHQLQNQAKADPGTSKRTGVAEKPYSGRPILI